MQREEGCFKVWIEENDRKIIFSRGTGAPRAHEVEWLYRTLIDMTKEWHESSWAYVAFIEGLSQVSPKGSTRYIKLHETLAANQCKYIAYVEGNSYEASVQAARHKEASNTPSTENKYFNIVDEALEWLSEKGY